MSQNSTTNSWMPGLFSTTATNTNTTSASSPSTAVPVTTRTITILPASVYGDGNRAHATMTPEFGVERGRKRARMMGKDEGVDAHVAARARVDMDGDVDVEAARPPYLHVCITLGGGGYF